MITNGEFVSRVVNGIHALDKIHMLVGDGY